ncbi:MAG: zinc ribbon domain-containing protein [Phycisphaerae bacterium]
MSETPPPSPNPTPEPTPNSTPAPDYTSGAPVADPADVEKNKIMAILAYLGILVLVPLLAAKESPFARYHTNQGLILAICAVVGGICLMIIGFVAIFIPFVGFCVGCTADLVVVVGILVLAIMGIINAANGKMVPLPVIGNLFTIIK